MNSAQRKSIAYNPELAVILALRATANATCAAIAAAHPFAAFDPASPEEHLAISLYHAIVRLERAAAAYCQFLSDLPQLGLFPPTDSLP